MTIEMVLRSPSLCIPVQFTSFSALKGEDGVGVPKGGRVGQVLKKASDGDFDTEWQDDVAGGGGTVVTLDGVAQQTFPADSFVDDAIAQKVVDGAPASLDTIGKLANALGNDPNFAEQTKTALAGKLDRIQNNFGADAVYTEQTNGSVRLRALAWRPMASNIAQFSPKGTLKSNTATEDNDTVPLAQMNEALTEKADTKAVDTLSKKVDNLWVGQAPDMFFDDDATAYVKEIPDDVAPYAAVKSVGGMIHAHQLPPPNLFKASVLDAENGRTYYDENNNQDPILYANNGTYTVNLANYNHGYYDYTTAATVRELFPDAVAGKKYTFSYDAQGESDTGIYFTGGYQNGTFTMTDAILDGHLVMNGAQTLDEYDNTYWPTEATYSNISLTEEGGGERYLTEAKVTALEIRGANLLKYPYRDKPQTVNGVTFTDNGDGRVTVNGTATETTLFRLEADMDLHPNLVYTLSGMPNVSGLMLYITYAKNGAWYKEYYNANGNNATFTTEEGCTYNVQILVDAGATINNAVVRPMLNAGDTAAPFSLYHAPHTFAIPEAVQAMDGYGWGTPNGAVNGVEWDDEGRATFVKRVERVVFNGTEAWVISDTATEGKWRNYLRMPNIRLVATTEVTPAICNYYDANSAGDTWYCKEGVATSDGVIIYDEEYNTKDVSLWKAHLAELYQKGDPLTIYYELAEPIVTDISQYFTDDNLIPVEGGGVIVAVNENEEAAPTTIRYQVTGATLADAFDQIHEYAMQKIGGTT